MTNFNKTGDYKSIEHWERIAERKSCETGVATRILGAIACGGIGLALSVELLGLAAGGYLSWSAYERFKQSGKNLKLVRENRCIAQVFDEGDFRLFVEQFGDKEVLEQLNFAQSRGVELDSFASNWLQVTNKPHSLLEKQFSKALKGQEIQDSHKSESNIRISNVEPNFSLIDQLTSEPNNLFIVGLGGSGKGILVSNTLRQLKKQGTKIFLINGKDDPKETGYFDSVVDVLDKLHCETATPQEVKNWFEIAIAKYDEFAAINNGALLVIDEGTIIGARLKSAKCTLLKDKLIGITSCGGSQGKFIWFTAQTPYVGSNGSDLSAISQLTPVVLVSHKNLSVLDSWKRASIFKKFDVNHIQQLVEASECGRAIYLGRNAQWYSMPILPNHSIFDRDAGKLIAEIPHH